MNRTSPGVAQSESAAEDTRAARKRRLRSMRFSRTFCRGFIVLIPLLLTIYLLALAVAFVEASVGAVIRLAVPEGFYYPGMGLASVIVLIFLFGLLLQAWVVRQAIRFVERRLERVPIVKSIYTAISDMIAYFRKTGRGNMSQVVLVALGPQHQVLGLMTREDMSDLPFGPARRRVAVYLPMSYQLGGYTVFVPRSAVRPLDMSFEEAMRFILTAGAGGNEHMIEEELNAIEHDASLKKQRRERDEVEIVESASENLVGDTPNSNAPLAGEPPDDLRPT